MLKKLIIKADFKKKLASIALLVSLLVSQFSVFGDADTDKVLSVGERQVWYQDSSLNGAETGFVNFKLGGRIAYCVDYRYYSPANGIIPTYVGKLSSQSAAVFAYGYPNATPAQLGCNSAAEAELATQLAFWNVAGIQGDCDSYVKLNLNNLSAANGHGADFDRALAAAKALAAKAFNNPYNPNPSMKVSGSNADIKVEGNEYVAGPYNVSVSDAKIGKYEVALTQAPNSAYVTNADGTKTNSIAAGSSFYIKWAASEEGQTIKYDVKATAQKSSVAMYRTGKNGIQSVAQEVFEDVSLKVSDDLSFTTRLGSIEVIKMDQHKERIAGVVFMLKDSSGNVVGENTSDDNGVVRFTNVKTGTYTLVEKSAPEGYIMGTEPISVTVKTGETFRVECVNTKIEGVLKIEKVDDANMPLEGVKFEVLDSSKNVVDTIVTDKDGIAKTKVLSDGKYYFREVSAPAGVIVDKTEASFEIVNGNTVTKKVVNKTEKGNLKIVKVDDTNAPLAGVTFEILNAQKEVVDTVVTNQKGEATSKYLTVGTYYYRETKVPDGIILDSTEKEFKITASNCNEIKVVNQRIKGSLKIVKVDDTNKPVAGVKFEIKNSNGKVVETLTTNEKGEATSKTLVKGKYTYTEVSAPAGYVMDKTTYDFEITNETKIIEKTVVNKLAKGSLKIIKVDDSENPLAGVTFEILDENKNVIATLVTGKDGVTNSEELDYGTYYFREVSAPEGVVIDTTEFKFEVKEDGQVIVRKVVNNMIKGKLKILKVDDTNSPIEGVTFEIKNSQGEVVDTLVTDKDGMAESKVLSYGKYTYKEISAPNGVIMDEQEREFSITENNKILVKKIINNRAKASLEIVKTDDNKMPLEGVTFEILDENKKVVTTVTTDVDGKAEVKDLTNGKYYYREIKVPANIILDNTLYSFEMNGTKVVKEIENKIIRGSLKVIKTDDVNKKPLAGVKFEIYDENKDLVDTIVTDEKGEAISKELVYGKYTYAEVEVPDGIVLDSQEYPFEITENEKVIVRQIVNTRIKGNLQILKLDEDTKEPIAGVKFQILDAEGNVIETITTNAEGIAKSSTLLKGTYSFKEVEAPEKYTVVDQAIDFEISSNGELVERTVYNKAKTLPVTGGLGTDNLIFLLVSIISTLGYITLKKRKED